MWLLCWSGTIYHGDQQQKWEFRDHSSANMFRWFIPLLGVIHWKFSSLIPPKSPGISAMAWNLILKIEYMENDIFPSFYKKQKTASTREVESFSSSSNYSTLGGHRTSLVCLISFLSLSATLCIGCSGIADRLTSSKSKVSTMIEQFTAHN